MEECSKSACRVGIAIVEDEKGLVNVYERVFARNGIQICFVAYDGLDAIKKYIACTPKPHVMLMDYRLPIKDGLETTKELLKIDPDAKIIFISADIGVEKEAMSAGALMFLKKPVHISTLVNAVKSALEQRFDKI